MHFVVLFLVCLARLANTAYSLLSTKIDSTDIATRDSNGYRSVAYFVNWGIYARDFHPQDIPAERLTHVLYAFANAQDSGEVIMSDDWSDTDKYYSTDSWTDSGSNVYGCVKQLFLLKKKNRNLKVLLSIRGWTYSSNLKKSFKTEEGRQNFANSSIELLKNLGFNGIDVDFEYPANNKEAGQFIDILRRLREASFRLYFAGSAKSFRRLIYTVQLIITAIISCLPLHRLLDTVAGHNANLHPSNDNPGSTPFNTDQAINYYISHGVASHKIVMGMPLYGRAFSDTNGPSQAYNGVGASSWENGVWDYKALPQPCCAVTNLDEAAASYCYNSKSRLFISYDTTEIARKKGEYIKSNGLGGGMWWELSGDKQGDDSLIATVVDTVGGTSALEKSGNQLSYPASKYDNLRAGF
ncbi:Glycoside hydrolase, family 18, catalytic domain [Penicillium camemberti]|uniref:chitinase n=1 Tax=Penicillium camemberti (strain FM 013) TaxID=1429867 RepID=A0A0G4NZ90_PENC3|nr:Glycoside hydrolase, family 18, catalytic domain [Penicillium camemberti]